MNKTIFKQADSQWGSLSYPKGATMAGSGCGCVALTHIAIEQADKASWNPKKVRKYILEHNYAIAGQGTRWEGITETLKWLGHKKVVRVYDADPMSKAWKELNKGNRIGILLFNSNTAPNGIKWTSYGHYVAFTAYRYKNGRHQFYCKDSGYRNHDGWYSYERSMKGCLPKMWIVERIPKLQKFFDAMKTQFNYSKNQKYKWRTPTISSSKSEGTCVTFVACSLQRIGLLKSGKYLYLDPKTGNLLDKSGAIKKHPDVFKVIEPHKSAIELGSKIKKFDICMWKAPSDHIMVFMGFSTRGIPKWNTMGHTRGLNIRYKAYENRNIDRIIRLKKVTLGK